LEIQFNDDDDMQMVSPSVCSRLWVDQNNPEPIIEFPHPDDTDEKRKV